MTRAETPAPESCSNGHPWTTETTRWRTRTRNGRISRERDCLRCKGASENLRRRNQRAALRGAA